MTGMLWARMTDSPSGPGVGVIVRTDPLGPVNKILTIVRHNGDGTATGLKSRLYPIRAGQAVQLVHDVGAWDLIGGGPAWRVEVDEQTVLTLTDAELWTPSVAPPVPLWRRFRHWTARTARSITDGLTGRHRHLHEGECGGDW